MTADIQWIAHDGGPNPVRERETLAHFRRDGSEWLVGQLYPAASAPWETITHYAVTPPRREPTAEPATDPIFAAIHAEIAKIDARRAMLVKMLEVGE